MNSAVIISQQSGSKVILVDMDLQFGDVGMLMNIKPRATMYDALLSDADDFYDQIAASIIKESDQLDVLLAPKRPDQAEAYRHLK